MAKLTLLIVAQQGGGKGTATKHIIDNFDASSCRFSTPIRAVADERGIAQTRENLQEIGQEYRRRHGEDVWERLMIEHCQKSESSIVVVDGAREKGEIGNLIQAPETRMIFLDVPKAVRKARLVDRGENEGESDMTDAEFERAENHVNERAITEMVEWVQTKYPEKLIRIPNNAEWKLTAEILSRLLPHLIGD